jgi:ligand-binding SRPBCC domain-containing protein
MYYELTDHFVVSASIEKTWQFFGAAENLPAITPPWLRFTILTPAPIRIGQDTLLDYTIRWAGVPIRWRTRIIDWTPPRQFIDLQVRGPYTLWHHQHTFNPVADGVECTDRVIYKVPVAGIGRAMHALTIRRQLLDIFRFRREVIGRELGWVRAVQPDVLVRPLS